MDEVKPGDFCCVPIKGAVGGLISFGEWLNGDGFGSYDHAEIYIGNISAAAPYGYTFGAYPGGATYKVLSCMPESLPGSLWSSGKISLGVKQRTSIVSFAEELAGTPYSALDYLALSMHRFHVPLPFLKSYISSSHHMICSQLVDYVYAKAGVHLFEDNRWPGYVTPADLAHLIGG